jgi:hypothetical protein
MKGSLTKLHPAKSPQTLTQLFTNTILFTTLLILFTTLFILFRVGKEARQRRGGESTCEEYSGGILNDAPRTWCGGCGKG